MMNIKGLEGKKLAVLLMGKTPRGKDDWVVIAGTLRGYRATFFLDRGSQKKEFEIRQEWLGRIKSAGEDIRNVLGDVELYLPLTVDNLPADADLSQYRDTGLDWPKRK